MSFLGDIDEDALFSGTGVIPEGLKMKKRKDEDQSSEEDQSEMDESSGSDSDDEEEAPPAAVTTMEEDGSNMAEGTIEGEGAVAPGGGGIVAHEAENEADFGAQKRSHPQISAEDGIDGATVMSRKMADLVPAGDHQLVDDFSVQIRFGPLLRFAPVIWISSSPPGSPCVLIAQRSDISLNHTFRTS